MISRPFWLTKLDESWKRRSLIWLSGVRRSGKTTLCKMIHGAVYLNCDLPSVNRQLENPEFFFNNIAPGKIVVLDEIHRLQNPSQVLKIGTDEFPRLKILATGSSTLEATKKFRDSLTGRKTQIFLPPIMWNECLDDFGIRDFDRRLLNGGLPEFLLSEVKHGELYSEWMDSYYARDIQELFSVRNRTGFLTLMQLVFIRSGGILEISSLAKESGLSRPTVMAHLESMEVAHAVTLVFPFYGGGKKEIVKRPKVYAFDTGFVTHVRGWNEIRESDRGVLWEHLVLDMLHVLYGIVYYWTDKNKKEIDFIIKGERGELNTVECKINPDKYSPEAVKKFREYYPLGRNYCLSPHIKVPYKLSYGDIEVHFQSVP
ncbi:MAG: ATPase [Bacteroidetes bacterium RBG_13_43_22]|nr:MAG: ATPase [Bacteroidetes bacterium RBG_13_43_22]OFY74544.1 MAG: ATPase [Bacteroidetes bacterium RBG_19FT_COMBO_42_7]